MSWGLFDQGFSSATNLGLAVLAGRLTGPGGLGVVYLGFSAYLAAISLQRALVTDPLVVYSARKPRAEGIDATRKALTVAITAAAGWAVLLVVVGRLVPGPDGPGLIAFAPWLIGASLQDFWRAVLFRDGRGPAATLNDGLWAVVMATTIPLVLVVRQPWIIVLSWGVGATAGGLLGLVQTGLLPTGLRGSLRWWRREAWPLGRWLGALTALSVVLSLLLVFALAGIVGTDGLGGLRAVQAVFGPISLLAQAVAFPGLPLLSRLVSISRARARAAALRLSAAAVGLVFAYLAIVALLPRNVLGLVFGHAFDRYGSLILPTAVIQVMIGWALGLGLLVKAEGRGRPLALSGLVGSTANVVLALTLAATSGLTAAVWGMAIAAAAEMMLITVIALRPASDVTELTVDLT
jgi:O-antigen/teichoic acid export membrane protein